MNGFNVYGNFSDIIMIEKINWRVVKTFPEIKFF